MGQGLQEELPRCQAAHGQHADPPALKAQFVAGAQHTTQLLLEEAADETPEVVLDVTSPGRLPDAENVRSYGLEVVTSTWKS